MKRDRSIDFLMFLAVLLVVNSHLESMYVEPFKPLATGGVIGYALFFFCSGYKLFLGRLDRFDNWYKRRILRIYPSVIVWDVIAAITFALPLTVDSLFDGWWFCGYWFIKCIMLHYVALYFVRKYFEQHLKIVLGLVCSGIVIWWCLAYSPKFAMAMLGASKFEWFYLFAFTLLGGAFVGCKRPEIPFGRALALVGLAFVCHYGWLELVGCCPVLMPVRCLLLLPLAMIICSLYYLSKTSVVCRLMDSWGGVVVSALGGLCLEVYISHGMFETAKFNHLFPLNILGFFIVAFLVAYLVRCVTRFVLQTLNKDQKYDYHSVFKT